MIIKSFELNKTEYKEKFFLLYGENQGHKDEIINNKFKKKYAECTYFYDENQILNNQESFFNEISSNTCLPFTSTFTYISVEKPLFF